MNDYELIERLSRGHAYDVYDAWSHQRGCRCVVRMLRPDRRRDRGARADLLREGRLLERLTHPHLVRAYEIRSRPPMVVLETLGGATLAALLEHGPLDRADLVQLGLQLGSAVRYLHRNGVLHLDLKPDNLIAEAGRLKVIDLSIAQPPGPIEAGTGTRRWMAPEQVRGGTVTAAADVWGIGRVLAAAGGGDFVTDCLREEPEARLSVDELIALLSSAFDVDPTPLSARPPDPQPAA
jgi:eukaryotic-like serine/threonine-protein kinase